MNLPINQAAYRAIDAPFQEVSDGITQEAIADRSKEGFKYRWRIATFDGQVWMNCIGSTEWALAAYEKDGEVFACSCAIVDPPLTLSSDQFQTIAPLAILESLHLTPCATHAPLPSCPPSRR
jgi:hypothetical protein